MIDDGGQTGGSGEEWVGLRSSGSVRDVLATGRVESSFGDFFRDGNRRVIPSTPVIVGSSPALVFAGTKVGRFGSVVLNGRPTGCGEITSSRGYLHMDKGRGSLRRINRSACRRAVFRVLNG